MGANRLEKFETQIINRQTINEADYNPRKISESAAKKLRGFLRDHGLWSPLVVNKRTMTLVSGHQRLCAMDILLRKPDYDITVAMVDVDEADEVKGNVFFNNPSAMGEWDVAKLEGLSEMVPDIDFVKDFGFDESEVSIMFGDDFIKTKENPIGVNSDDDTPEHDTQHYRDIKKKIRDEHRQGKEAGVGKGAHVEDIDYSVTVVFPNNHEKRRFMRSIRKEESGKYIKSSTLVDIYNREYNIVELAHE